MRGHSDKVFPTEVTDLTRRKDFLAAGLARVERYDRNGLTKKRIVTEDEEGRVIDLHAMRTTLGTELARQGVASQIAQQIMRHRDYRTTLRHYTSLSLADATKGHGGGPEGGAWGATERATLRVRFAAFWCVRVR
jgi:integrase